MAPTTTACRGRIANPPLRSGLSFLRGSSGTGFRQEEAGDGTRTRDPWLGKPKGDRVSERPRAHLRGGCALEHVCDDGRRVGDRALEARSCSLVEKGAAVLAAKRGLPPPCHGADRLTRIA